MMTARCRWVIGIAGCGLVTSLLASDEGIALASLTLLTWVGVEWVRMQRCLWGFDQLARSCQRIVRDNSQDIVPVSIDQQCLVQLRLKIPARCGGRRMRFEDLLPAACAATEPSASIDVDAMSNQVVAWQYRMQPSVTGNQVLPGLHVTVMDPQGLFCVRRFLPLRQTLTVLPFLIRPQTTVSILKRNDVQLLTGTHQHRRPGFSTELLGIRDYQPGDPPRTIAWKATARLGKLMTCEYESEVPVRATIIADLYPYQFTGRPQRAAADRITCGAASIARLLLADRDPVACLLLSEGRRVRTSHGHGERQLTRLLQSLMNFSQPRFLTESIPANELVSITWQSCFRQYPELFDESLNPSRYSRFSLRADAIGPLRRQLSVVLAELFDGGTNAAVEMQIHDDLFLAQCRHYLNSYPATIDLESYFPAVEKQEVLRCQAIQDICQGLIEGVARANDNELYVVLASAPTEVRDLERLEESIRVARAALHRIIFIDVAPAQPAMQVEDAHARRVLATSLDQTADANYTRLEQRLTRLGVKLTRLDDPRLIEKVASEVELLRTGRARSRSGSSTPARLP